MKKYNNLKQIREIYGATQEQIAEAISVNRVTVANWEAGNSVASGSNREKLSIYYGIGPEFFYDKELTEDEFLNLDGITVITGDGGSGKTQYLRHLVNTYSKSNLESLLFYIEFTKISSYLTDNNITLIDILYKVFKDKIAYEG